MRDRERTERQRYNRDQVVYLSKETNDRYPKREEKLNQHDSREHFRTDRLESL